MTHADLRERLRSYADGTLADHEAELVRVHLASGCVECLRDVFTRPVGLPRAPIAVRRPPSSALVVIGAGVAVAIGLAALGLPGRRTPGEAPASSREPGLEAELARLREQCDAADAKARERIERMEARLAESEGRAPAGRSPSVVPVPSPSAAPAIEPDVPPAPGRESAAPGAGRAATAPDAEAVPGWLSELLSSGATRSVAMTAAPFVAGANGYAVWNATRGVVVLSASGLPPEAREPVYRLRVTLEGGRAVSIGALAASERGTLTVTAALPDGGGRVTAVELFRDPTAIPALSARTAVARRTEPARPAPWRVYP